MNGRDGKEEPPAGPADDDSVDTMDAVPAHDDEPGATVQHVGPVNGHAAADDALEIPEFLRRVH